VVGRQVAEAPAAVQALVACLISSATYVAREGVAGGEFSFWGLDGGAGQVEEEEEEEQCQLFKAKAMN
jgi:hypothetical protein